MDACCHFTCHCGRIKYTLTFIYFYFEITLFLIYKRKLIPMKYKIRTESKDKPLSDPGYGLIWPRFWLIRQTLKGCQYRDTVCQCIYLDMRQACPGVEMVEIRTLQKLRIQDITHIIRLYILSRGTTRIFHYLIKFCQYKFLSALNTYIVFKVRVFLRSSNLTQLIEY